MENILQNTPYTGKYFAVIPLFILLLERMYMYYNGKYLAKN